VHWCTGETCAWRNAWVATDGTRAMAGRMHRAGLLAGRTRLLFGCGWAAGCEGRSHHAGTPDASGLGRRIGVAMKGLGTPDD
jgi:hypothetical protein